MTAVLTSMLPSAQGGFQHAEARHTHPLALNAAKTRLAAVDSINARLSVFDVSGEGAPILIAQIPTGLEPVAVRFRTEDEVWVVNELSDSISVISISQKAVLATLPAADEPADVVFAQEKAFVACARSNHVRVFDAVTRTLLDIVSVEGVMPRALAASDDGSRVYAAFFDSGNGTTILPKEAAPPQPAPTRAGLPPPPQTALIVAADDPRVSHVTLDHDVVAIDAADHSIAGYATGVGTTLFDLAVRPAAGDIWVANTEALNLIRFEPNLRGRFARNRLTRIAAATGAVSAYDLNPGIDYDILPNPPAQAAALAQPASLVFSADGHVLWVAAFASDRIAKVSAADAAVLGRADLRLGNDVSPAAMRGPRGLALDEQRGRLYVLNKLAYTISIVSTDTLLVAHEAPISPVNPMPAAMRAGQGFLHDARLSGNGTVSCGTCHFDADRDGLAWDLGDPGGEMMTVMGANFSIHEPTLRPRVMHPMKGPMTTQTLRGMQGGAPFHWRGDRATLADFNPTFDRLMGGEEIVDEDMQALTQYLQSIVNHPNPNRNADRSMPASFAGGDPAEGFTIFNNHSRSHCGMCHALPKGSDNNIDLPQEVGSTQPIKTPALRSVYQRLNFNPRAGQESLSGFGMLHDGTGFMMPIVHPFVLDNLNLIEQQHVLAFILLFDTGTAPAVGMSTTVTAATRGDAGAVASMNLLEARAAAAPADCDLVVRGLTGENSKSFLYVPAAKTYRQESAASAPLTRSALLDLLDAGGSLTFLGTLPGSGARLSIDEDDDGLLNGDDPDPGLRNGPPLFTREPADRVAPPGTNVTLSVAADGVGLTYQWHKGTQPISGATGASLTLANVIAANAGSYSVTATNIYGSRKSRAAKVEVFPAPVISVQPASVTANEGGAATFSVTATGTGLTYQWRRGSAPIPGATSRLFRRAGVSNADAGNYNVEVRNRAGAIVSQEALLSIRYKPVMAALDLPATIVGDAYAAVVSAANAPTRFTVTGLPPGVTYNPFTGVISGRPTTAGTFRVKASAANAAGRSPELSQEVKVEPFPMNLIGTFDGIVPRDVAVNGNLGGRLKLTVTKTGACSGSLSLGAVTHALRGGMNVERDADPSHALVVRPRGKPEIAVSFTLHRNTRTLSGKVKIDGQEIELEGWLPDSRLDAYAGNCTLALALSDQDQNTLDVPRGEGHGGFKITTRGMASGVITLADGTRVLFSSPVGEGGRLPIHSLLYSAAGSVQGVLVFAGNQAPYRFSDASQISWNRQAQTRPTRLYKGGFEPLALAVIGGTYTSPGDGKIAMNLAAGPGNARLTFAEGGAPEPAARLNLQAFEIQGGSPAKILLPPKESNPGQIKLTVVPGKGAAFAPGATGVFSGSFVLDDMDTSVVPNRMLRRTATFSGALVDDGTSIKGCGFFILAQMPAAEPKTTAATSPQLSGRVRLEPGS